MPQGTNRSGKNVFHTLFLAAALSLLSAVVRRERRQLVMSTKARTKKVRVAPPRLAASLAFATLFFAGAALSAGAGNTMVTKLFDQTSDAQLAAESTSTETTTTEDLAAPVEPAPAPAEAPVEEAPDPGPSDVEPARAAAPETPVSAPVSNTDAAGVKAALSQRAQAGIAAQKSASSPNGTAAARARQKGRAWAPKSFLRQPPVV